MTTNKATTEEFIGLKLVACVFLVVAGPLVWGLAFQTLWNWIATKPPFGMPEMNLLAAIGVGTLLAMISKIPDGKSEPFGVIISNAFQRWFLYLLLVGLFALYRAVL